MQHTQRRTNMTTLQNRSYNATSWRHVEIMKLRDRHQKLQPFPIKHNTGSRLLWRWFGIRDFCRSVKISLRQSPIGLPLWELQCSHRGYHRNKCQLTKADKLKWRKDDDCKPWSRYMVHSSKSPQKYNRGVVNQSRSSAAKRVSNVRSVFRFDVSSRVHRVLHRNLSFNWRAALAPDSHGGRQARYQTQRQTPPRILYARQVFFDDENDLIQSLCTLWSLSGRWHGHWQREGSLYAAHTHTRAY